MITRTEACEGGWGRAGNQPLTRVTVDPGGRAWIALRYDAAMYERDESCKERRVGPLAAGRYHLRVRIPSVPRRVEAALVVTR